MNEEMYIQNLTALNLLTTLSNWFCVKSFCPALALAIPLLYLRIKEGLMPMVLANQMLNHGKNLEI